jgi:hypothetical protein
MMKALSTPANAVNKLTQGRACARYRRLSLILGFAAICDSSSAFATNHGLFGTQPTTILAPTSYHVVVPTAYTVVLPSVSHSYVLAPTVQLLPATWVTTTSFAPAPCTAETLVSPALEPTKVPELRAVPERAPEQTSEPTEKPAAEPKNEPQLDNPGASAKSPEVKKPEPVKPATTPPVKEEKESADPSPPLPPEVKKPEPVKPATPPPAATNLPGTPPPADSIPANLPPEKPALKPADLQPLPPPAELPKTLDNNKDTLLPPPSAPLPKSNDNVPPLKPSDTSLEKTVQPTTSTSIGPREKPPVEDAAKKATDLPPPVIDLPKSPEPAAGGNLPAIPIPDLPPPADDLALPPVDTTKLTVPELPENKAGKPVDPETIKSGGEMKKAETEIKRESFKPVISSAKPALPKLNLLVKDKLTGALESSVAVLLREPSSSQIKMRATTDQAGKSLMEIPEGRWEVLVETKSGPLFVLGELISKDGKVTTVKGRDLPTLEIGR